MASEDPSSMKKNISSPSGASIPEISSPLNNWIGSPSYDQTYLSVNDAVIVTALNDSSEASKMYHRPGVGSLNAILSFAPGELECISKVDHVG